jgi:hypothetical protein
VWPRWTPLRQNITQLTNALIVTAQNAEIFASAISKDAHESRVELKRYEANETKKGSIDIL